jgi:hypothetical protein
MAIFPSGDEVLIGPNPHMLSRAMNLRGRYIDPLLSMIRENRWEPETVPSGARSHERQQLPGVFQEDPTQSLVLLMNFGADPEWTWSQLIPQLESLREAGFLTHFNGSAIVQGPITIVATGNVSFYRILETSTFRDIFFDAPLLQLVAFDDQDFLQGSDYSFRNSYYASADFLAAIGNVNANGFSNKQLADVRQQVRLAHGLGLKVRYVITSHWPYHLRNYVWRMLVREGVDIVTVDGLSH